MSAPVYSIDMAVARLKRSKLWNSTKVSKEFLVGTIGENRVFFTQSKPLSSSASPLFWSSFGSTLTPIPADQVEVDYETGCVVFATSPTDPILADYTFVDMTDAQLADICRDGLGELERRWSRDWLIYTAAGTDYVARFDGSSYVDPPVPGTAIIFSASEAQIALYIRCCEYGLVKALASYAAASYFSWRADRSGQSIDRSKQPDQLRALLADLDKQIDQEIAKLAIAEEGGWVENKMTPYYEGEFEWQTNSGKYRRGSI